MIQVAWQVPNSQEWIGGLNYFVNLASALFSLQNRQIEPVLLGPTIGLPRPLTDCRALAYPRIYQRRWNPWRVFDVVQRRYLDNGGVLGAYLKRNNIHLLSHGQLLGRHSPVPAMCWIPDFQHIHLPHFFTPQECKTRDIGYENIAFRAQAIVLSSEDARKDFARLFPEEVAKTHVLHFVAIPNYDNLPSFEEVCAKYSINEPYLHVPNQLWAHKNHTVIANAMMILRKCQHCPLVISTGQTSDYRNPAYFAELREKVRKAGLQERFRFLGFIPYRDILVLMRGAIAMINPSFFEGWSTTVEEAKSLGKRLLLSDICVHKEQNPIRSTYFNPHNPEELANAMLTMIEEYDPEIEQLAMEEATAMLPQRIYAYGRKYEDIVLNVIK